MSRRVLSEASGVSERYLAELERGSGNASLLVLRNIADAMGLEVTDLVAEDGRHARNVALIAHRLARLSPADEVEVGRLITERFGRGAAPRSDRIALIGLRGAGKTTLGTALAARLAVPFVELDREIERASGMELAEIFATRGQSGFRRLEHDCLERVVAAHPRAVIATGGSLVTEARTYDLLLSSCFVVWLRCAPESHMSRVAAQGDLRPMAQSPEAMDDLKAILESRAALYAKADAELDTSGLAEPAALAGLVALVPESVGR